MISLAGTTGNSAPTPLPGRAMPYPRGKVSGGSSAVNGVVALRGVPEDYDEWAALDNPAWAWREVLPWFRRIEDDPEIGGDAARHRRAGPGRGAGAATNCAARQRAFMSTPAARSASRRSPTTTTRIRPASAPGR